MKIDKLIKQSSVPVEVQWSKKLHRTFDDFRNTLRLMEDAMPSFLIEILNMNQKYCQALMFLVILTHILLK